METTFRKFLLQKIEEDHAFHLLRPTIRKIDEMAMYGDRIRMPVNIDEDDIEFLNQFPHPLWPQAYHQRYKMLFKAVKKQHDVREALGVGELKKALIDAMRSGDYSKLNSFDSPELRLSDEEIEKLKKTYDPDYIRTLDDKHVEMIADEISWNHIKKATDHVDDPETAEFKFKQGRQTVTYNKKPFLNRLYHKVERTAGLEHLPGSGLEGQIAKYGYDLRNPKEDPHGVADSTDGMVIPRLGQIEDRMRDFMNLQAHRMFGSVDGPDVVWKKVAGEDSETAEQFLSLYRKGLEPSIRRENPDMQNNQVLSLARKKAKEKLAEKFPNGELRGPAYPGVPGAENGFPVTFKRKENGEIKVINPPLYLPFRKKEDGTIDPNPLVKAASFYRKIKPSDYARDKYGNFVKDENGNYVLNVSPDKVVGHKRDHIKVDDKDFSYGVDIQKGGAIDPNHNTEEENFLVPGTEEYQKAYNAVFADQKEVAVEGRTLVDAEHTGLFRDIMQGIMNCIRGNCGGMSDFEASVMLQNIEQIHGLIYLSMCKTLNFKDEAKSLKKKNNRVEFALKKASSYAQKDHGGGTRRLRAFTQTARDQQTYRHTTARRFDTSGMNFPYRISNYRQWKDEMNAVMQAARKADQEAQSAVQNIQASIQRRQAASDSLSTLLVTSLKSRSEVADELVELLAMLHQEFAKDSTTDSKKYAEDQIKSLLDQNLNSEQLVAAFQGLPLVQTAAQQLQTRRPEPAAAGGESNLHDEMRFASTEFNQDFAADLQQARGNKQDPAIMAKYKPAVAGGMSRYVMTVLKPKVLGDFQYLSQPDSAEDLDKVLKAAQKSIDERLAMPELPTASAAGTGGAAAQAGGTAITRIGPNPGGHFLKHLYSKTPEGYFHAVHDPVFQSMANPDKLKTMRDYFQQNADKYHPEDHASAINTLNNAIRRKEGA